MAEVRMDAMLSQFVPKRTFRSPAPSVEALLDDLEERYPRLRNRLRDETATVRPFVRIFVNGEEVRPRGKVPTLLRPQDKVDILHSIQGG